MIAPIVEATESGTTGWYEVTIDGKLSYRTDHEGCGLWGRVVTDLGEPAWHQILGAGQFSADDPAQFAELVRQRILATQETQMVPLGIEVPYRELEALESDVAYAGAEAERARREAAEAMGRLRAAVIRAVDGGLSQSAAARVAGVDRMTVRNWLGK